MTGDQDKDQALPGEELTDRLAAAEAAIDALQERADRANDRSSADEARATEDRGRIGDLEGRVHMDRALIAELQAEGVIRAEHAANLEEALRSSRTIGAAIGIVMAHRKVTEVEAFELLRKTSMDSNRKLRVLAEDVVVTGDLSGLQTGQP